MSKNKIYILKTLILLCITVGSSFYVISTPPGKRRPGEASNRTRQVFVAPAPATQSPDQVPVAQSATSSEDKNIAKIPAAAEKELEKNEEESYESPEEPKAKTAIVSQARHVQAPEQGWLASAYTTVAPIILVTFDKAIGGGLAAATKNAIKLFDQRNQFKNLQNEAKQQAEKLVESGEYDAIALPKQEKINLLAKKFFTQHKIDPDEMEKATSLSSIFSQLISRTILNTMIPMVSTFIGYGITLSLQALMPAGNQ
jgi:hypothetical protein